jgi:hypothetical protein
MRARVDTCKECGIQIKWYENDHNVLARTPRFVMCADCCFQYLRPIASKRRHLRRIK